MGVESTTFEALGRSWTFKFGFAAVCRVEAQYNRPFGEVVAEMLPGLTAGMLADPELMLAAAQRLRHDHLGALIAAGLGAGVTVEQVAEIMDELGLERALELIFQASANDVSGGPAPKKAVAPARKPRKK